MKISPCTRLDIPELLELINSGYRGEASKAGWTTEADLLIGEQRIDGPGLKEMMDEPGATMLKALDPNNNLVGCVYLQKQEKGIYLGLLTVAPQQQASGIGKGLLQAADKFARNLNCTRIFMTVISLRSELIAWYQRKGYQLTGESKPFPSDPRFGLPTRNFNLLILEKKISLD